MKTLIAIASLLAAAPAMALPESLINDAKTAFADIQKAKAALDSGSTKTSSGLLGRAEGLLRTVLDKAPGGSLLTKTEQAQAAAHQGNTQQSQGMAAQVQADAQKVDPSIAQQAEPAKNGEPGALNELKSVIAGKTGLADLVNAYDTVKNARSLLNSGEVQKAKGLLDKIPSFSSLHLP